MFDEVRKMDLTEIRQQLAVMQQKINDFRGSL